MKKLSKNTFAKLFATFLGASTILTPLVTIVSCQPISKSPTIEQQNSNKNQNGNNNQNQGGSNNQNQGGEATDPLKNIVVETTGDANNPDKYILSGSFNIDDIKKVEEKINNYGETPVEITSLNINCFSIKTEGVKTQSITSRNATPSTISYVSKTITPTILKDVLKLKGIKNNTLLTLNNNSTISIPFESTIEKPFDISDLAKFSFSEGFKLADGSKIILGSTATKQTSPSDHDITPYPKVHELLKLLNNEKLKNNITVKDVYITGNVKDLLPLLVEGPNKIKEVDGGIKFLNHVEVFCPGPNVTKYDGGKDNNTPLPLEQFIEFSKRTNEHHDDVIDKQTRPLDIDNLILKDIDTTTINEEQLQFLHFNGHLAGGKIIFKDSNLSKMEYRGTTGPSNVIFDNTTLPYTMQSSSMGRLTLKNVTFPKEEFKNVGAKIRHLPYFAPGIGTLTIHGEVKNSPLKDLTQEQIEKLKKDTQKPREMPRVYKGSQEIYDRLKYIYRGESNTKEFGNLQGSIQKPQDTFLALLGKNNSRG